MNRIKKNVVVRFFSIEAKKSFFNNFVSSVIANKNNFSNSKIFNLRNKKHLIKISHEYEILNITAYAVTVVRERNTWQVKAMGDGKITGNSLNQGIMGDPYFFFIIPNKQVLLGFTTGPSGSLKSVAKTMLEQFNNDRLEDIKINLIPKEKEFNSLNDVSDGSTLYFKINSSSLSDISDDAPKLIRELSAAPYIGGNIQLALDLEINNTNEKMLSKDDVIEIVNYLSDNEACTILKVKGATAEGEAIQLDFVNAFINYKAQITTRNKLSMKSRREMC